MQSLPSNRVDIALVTAANMPKPDPETHLLIRELERLGVRSEIIAWDSAVNWADIPVVVIRSTWDYYQRLPDFLSWARQVDIVSRLINPYTVVHWNCHKRYMQQLAAKGVPVVPTMVVEAGAGDISGRVLENCGWGEVVIKPAVSIGAIGALRAEAGEPAATDHLKMLLADGDVLIQPFVASVLTEGEISIIYFGGAFSHAIRKLPKSGEFRVQDHHGGTVELHVPSAEELGAAAAALAASPAPTVYARVDLVRLDGGPAVMELELIEPALFLSHSNAGKRRFAEILKHALEQTTG